MYKVGFSPAHKTEVKRLLLITVWSGVDKQVGLASELGKWPQAICHRIPSVKINQHRNQAESGLENQRTIQEITLLKRKWQRTDEFCWMETCPVDRGPKEGSPLWRWRKAVSAGQGMDLVFNRFSFSFKMNYWGDSPALFMIVTATIYNNLLFGFSSAFSTSGIKGDRLE